MDELVANKVQRILQRIMILEQVQQVLARVEERQHTVAFAAAETLVENLLQETTESLAKFIVANIDDKHPGASA